MGIDAQEELTKQLANFEMNSIKNTEKIAVEIIYDNKQEQILSYKEIDVNTLTKKWVYNKFVWVQYDNIVAQRRMLFDTQILTNF